LKACKSFISAVKHNDPPNSQSNKIVLLQANGKCDNLAVKPLGQVTKIGPRLVRTLLWWWGITISNAILGVRVVEFEIYAVLYQVGFTELCKLRLTTIQSFLFKSKSTSTLREGQFYAIIIHNSGKSSVDLVLKVWRGVYDIA
jgi:hypothetical protein